MTTKGCVCARAARAWGDDGLCSACGARVLESQLTPVLLQILCGGTGLCLWRNVLGYDQVRKLRYGLGTGSADYVGLYAPAGRFVAVELKTGRGRQSTEQVAWEALVAKLGGIYAVVRSPADAASLLTLLGNL
jgi:hypothetical protein